MNVTKTYFGLRDIIDPEGWPAAFEPKYYRLGCGMPIKDEARRKRLEEYRRLIAQGKPTPGNYLERGGNR